jgi:hypothetical protein
MCYSDLLAFNAFWSNSERAEKNSSIRHLTSQPIQYNELPLE